jgi:Uncharacterised nucleotidyltransferase
MIWVEAALRGAAAHGILGSRLECPRSTPTDTEFHRFLERLQAQRLIGLAASAQSVGQLTLTEDQASRLHSAHTDAMCICLRLEATLLDVQSAFADLAIPLRVLKGPSSAHLVYADPALRPFGDLDIMVRSADFDRAKGVLESTGFRRPAPEPRPRFDSRFGKGAEYVADDGLSVDLHRTFVLGPYGLRVDLNDIWAERESFQLAGRQIDALSPVHRLLAAAYNAVLGDPTPRLSTLRDIVQICLSGEVTTAQAVDVAAAWQAELVLALAVQRAWAELGVADVIGLSAWAERFEPDAAATRMLAIYHDPSAGYSGLSWATMRMLSGRQRVAFVRALAFPQGGRLGEAGFGLRQRVRRAARGYSKASP